MSSRIAQVLLVGDDQDVALHVASARPAAREHAVDHAQVLGDDVVDAELAARHRGQAEEAAHLKVVGRDGEFAAAQPIHALNRQRVGADPADLRAQAVQQAAQVLHVRLGRGVADDGRALRQRPPPSPRSRCR